MNRLIPKLITQFKRISIGNSSIKSSWIPSSILIRPLSTSSVVTRTKVASKRKYKNYKLKNNKAAVSRWMVLSNGQFKRGQAGRNHFNRKMRACKKKEKRYKVLADSTQRKKLRKLIPYFRKRYAR